MIPNNAKNSIRASRSYFRTFDEFDSTNKVEVIDFLKSSHTRYEKVLIPEIEQNFMGLMKILPTEPSVAVIFNLFVKFQISLELHMKIEEQTVYPSALEGTGAAQDEHDQSHAHEEPFLTEIIACLRRQRYSTNPFCQTLIHRLTSFDEELKEHAWIEENLI